MFGKLTWNAIPWDQPIPLTAAAVVLVVMLAVIAWVVVKGHLPYVWREWITSVDHKRIGVSARRASCRPSTSTRCSPRTAPS
jgi:cytochrome o ubiquinol oxidase subunit 1